LDTAKLRGLIVERGLTQKKVAEHLGMSEKTFYLKMKKGVFGTDDVQNMIELLNIEDPMSIFFTKQ